MNKRQTKKAWSRLGWERRWGYRFPIYRLIHWPERVRRNYLRSKSWPGGHDDRIVRTASASEN